MKIPKTYNKEKRYVLSIREEFVPYNIKPLDSKHRITLGGKLANSFGKRMRIEAYQIFVSKNGDILLRPTVAIPSNEAWIYRNPDVIASVRKGLQDAGEGKIKRVNSLDSFLDNL